MTQPTKLELREIKDTGVFSCACGLTTFRVYRETVPTGQPKIECEKCHRMYYLGA